jgi:hypothetical protein
MEDQLELLVVEKDLARVLPKFFVLSCWGAPGKALGSLVRLTVKGNR